MSYSVKVQFAITQAFPEKQDRFFSVWGDFLLSAVPKKLPVKKKNSQVKRNWSEMKGLKLE